MDTYMKNTNDSYNNRISFMCRVLSVNFCGNGNYMGTRTDTGDTYVIINLSSEDLTDLIDKVDTDSQIRSNCI